MALPSHRRPWLIGDLHTVALVGDERTRLGRSTSLLAVLESALRCADRGLGVACFPLRAVARAETI
jgi:hypothetical protein